MLLIKGNIHRESGAEALPSGMGRKHRLSFSVFIAIALPLFSEGLVPAARRFNPHLNTGRRVRGWNATPECLSILR